MYLLFNCVVYHLPIVFLMEAMDLLFWALRSSCLQIGLFKIFKIGAFKIFKDFTKKTPALKSFSIKLRAIRLATSLKRDSSTGVFVWSFHNFKEHHFYNTPPVDPLGTDVHANTKCLERSAVLWGGRDDTWRGLFLWFHSIWKTEVLG